LANLGPDASWFVKGLGFLSPFRYGVERMLRILLEGYSYVDEVCDFFNYTFKEKCIPIIIGFAVLFTVFSFVANLIKSKSL
jgi:hypothetical protein